VSRKICFITGTRAEYGLLRVLMGLVRDDDAFQVQVAVTGMHLSPEFGLTFREIEADGFRIDERVEMLLSSDTSVGVAKATGLGLIGFADAFERLKPDMLVVLGDRFEILAAATAGLLAGIPIAHIHGGETTEGAFDEAIRHSVTKMSHLHFVAAEPYRNRVIQLGEAPERVFLVGGLGIDAIERLELMSRAELERSLNFELRTRNLLVTFHPPTIEGNGPQQLQALLDALAALGDQVGIIFTMPNADTGGRELTRMVEAFVAAHPNARAYPSLGQLRYFSCMRQVDAVVGNSSSGLAEAPSFRIGTLNIGARQDGRLKAHSVIDCQPERGSLEAALAELLSPGFRAKLPDVCNPYGEPGASGRILEVLRDHPLGGLTRKRFYDIAPAACAPASVELG
jgi:UDP-hydrolysing UDP-N-acetyl-D-glucosamine 2-epimerase